MGGARELAALGGREVLADRVHLVDGGPAGQELLCGFLLVRQADAFHGRDQQRRAAAGHQADHQVALPGPCQQLKDVQRAAYPPFVRNRVPGFVHADFSQRQTVSVLDDQHPFGKTLAEQLLQGLGHWGDGFAGTRHQDAVVGAQVMAGGFRHQGVLFQREVTPHRLLGVDGIEAGPQDRQRILAQNGDR